MSVYVVQIGGSKSNICKIGMSDNIANRIKELKSQHGTEITLLALVAGGTDIEFAYQSQFGKLRISREYFRYEEPLISFVAKLGIDCNEKPSSLGWMIRAARKQCRRTIRSVAKEAELSINVLSQIESDHIREPSFRDVVKISYALGITLDSLAKAEK
jgi:DNA-binding phage protein